MLLRSTEKHPIFTQLKFIVLRNAILLFISFLIAGLLIITFTRGMAEDFTFSNGKQLVAYYIPLPLSLLFCLFSAQVPILRKYRYWLTLLFFILLLIPLSGNLLSTYVYYPQDDGFRYRQVATNIAVQHTLWGSDDLIYGTHNKTYMIQPGYRYYLASWIFLFGKENRLFQFFNMFIYLGAVVLLLKKMAAVLLGPVFRKGFMLFILLSSPFVVKQIMMGLTEWLAVTLFILIVCCYLSRWMVMAVILLALLPFLRQNLLFVSIFVFLWMMIKEKRNQGFIFLYCSVLLLPVYHNLYFAGKWKFFSTYNDTATFLVLDFEGKYFVRVVKTILFHLSLYGGINWQLHNFVANALSILFIPLGTFLLVYAAFRLKAEARLWLLLITFSAIVPTLILGGTAYYPRFEWVNICIATLMFIVLNHHTLSREKILSPL